jgi:hypothetical protein
MQERFMRAMRLAQTGGIHMRLRVFIGLAAVCALSGVGLSLISTRASTTPCPTTGIVHCPTGTSGGERTVIVHPLLPFGIVLFVGAIAFVIAAIVVARNQSNKSVNG